MELFSEFSQQLILISTITTILVEVIKKTQLIPQPERWTPAVSIIIAVITGTLLVRVDVLLSILAGATATGLYENVRRTIAGRTN